MLKKKSIYLGLLLSMIFILGACSEKETSTQESEVSKEPTSDFIMVSGDTVSEQGGCVLASRYSAGDKIVFRMNALDPITNEQIKDAKLQVHLSTGDVLDMKYGKHGDDNFWVVAYPVTADTPTGALDFNVTAEAGDRKGEFHPFNVKPSLLTIVDAEAIAVDGDVKEEDKASPEITPNQNVDIVATNFTFNEDKFYVKSGEEVTLNLTSKEGTHGIAIADLDVSIAEANGTVTFTPTKAGEYSIVCSVFCGAGHGDMTATLVVVE